GYNATLLATGGFGTITWTLESGSLPTGLTVDAAGSITGTPTEVDEVGQEFTFTLQAADECPEGIQTDSATFTVTLVGQTCDPVEITTTELPDPALNTAYDAAIEVSGGVGPFTFELTSGSIPTGLTLNADGTLTGTPTEPSEVGLAFDFEVTVTDSCLGNPSSDTQAFRVILQPEPPVCAPLAIENTGFPNAVIGAEYNATLLASGGFGELTWSLTEGRLPTGLTVDADGAITGTPTEVSEVGQTFTFTLQVSDECPDGVQTDAAQFSITLDAQVCEPVEITTLELPNPAVNTPYNATIETTGGADPLTFELTDGALPTGLTVNADGTITGTPTEESEVGQTFTFTVTVTDSCLGNPTTDSQEYTITLLTDVECEPVDIRNESFPNPQLGQAYNAALLASGVGPFTWELAAGRLPTGLTVEATGTLSGTPTDAEEVGQEFTFTLRVTDSCPDGAQTDEQEFTVLLEEAPACEPAPEITTESLPDAFLNTAYNAAVEATGGVGELTFALTAGELPTGLTLNADGTLSGTPTDAEQVGQEFTFDVTVTDECPFNPGTDTATFTITLQPEVIECDPLQIANTGFPNPALGSAYSAALLVEGGEAPFTWELLAGSLPTGLTVNPSGTLEGTPTNPEEVGQTFTFTLQVTDSCEAGAQTDAAEFSFTLEAARPCEPAPVIVTEDLPDPSFGVAYDAAVEATGGFGTLTFSLTGGVLPTGLTLNADGTITGTPSAEEEIGEDFTF
ncbi:MAG TPA: Ig domain-containing protein, partial [bacterium]|nr:Ig domain-containing protein [bacterium]